MHIYISVTLIFKDVTHVVEKTSFDPNYLPIWKFLDQLEIMQMNLYIKHFKSSYLTFLL